MAADKPRLVKSLTGKHLVKYGCPHCNEPLSSPLSQAGTTDNCPKCQQPFIVPGKAFADQLAAEQDAARQRKEAESQEKLRRKQELETQVGYRKKSEAAEQKTPEAAPFATVHRNAKGVLVPGTPQQTSQERSSASKLTIADQILRAFAILIFMYGVFWYFWMVIQVGVGERFQDDNAYGATANALELSYVFFGSCCICFFSLAIFFYVKLCQLVRK